MACFPPHIRNHVFTENMIILDLLLNICVLSVKADKMTNVSGLLDSVPLKQPRHDT